MFAPLRKRWLACLCAITLASASLAATVQNGPSSKNEQGAKELLSQAMNLAAEGRFGQADILLEQARTAAPHNTQVLTALAKVKGRVGELSEAIALFREVTNATPRSTEAYLNLAMALADNKDLGGALGEATKAVELSPKLASAHLNRARILADMHRASDARAEFELASQLAPTNADCYFYWALVERENDNYVKESSLLRTVVRLQPENEKAINLLGQSLMNESKEAEAIAAWRHVLKLDPNSSEATYSLALALRNTDDAESKRLMQRFHQLQEQDKHLHQINTLGNEAYEAMNNHQWPQAITLLRQAIDLCGECSLQAALHKDLGLSLCQSGDLHTGETELRIAQRLNPADPDVLKALAMIPHS
jgi:Flp pilus assembly protein TadD